MLVGLPTHDRAALSILWPCVTLLAPMLYGSPTRDWAALSTHIVIACYITRAHVVRFATHDRAAWVHACLLPHARGVSLAPSKVERVVNPIVSPLLRTGLSLFNLYWENDPSGLLLPPIGGWVSLPPLSFIHMNVAARTLPNKGGGM